MAYSFPPELRQLVETGMATGRYASEDELLQDALESLAVEAEEAAAIEAAIADWHSGDAGVPLDTAFAEIRQRP